MNFLKNLWKTQPNTVMGFGALLILIGFVFSLRMENATYNTPKPPSGVNKEILEKRNATPKTYKLTAQEVVDKHELKMRWACEDAIKSQLVDQRSYKAVKVRFTPHKMNEHPDAVVDARISFDAKNSFGGNAPSFGRCAFDSYGNMVRSPNVVSGY